jgi:hypothetical protein
MFIYLFIYGVFNNALRCIEQREMVGWLTNNELERS